MTVDVVIKQIGGYPVGRDTKLYPKKTSTFKVRDFFERQNDVRIIEPVAGQNLYIPSDAISVPYRKLDVPYRSQLDNRLNPTGSCNVTSVAMCLLYLKAKFDKVGEEEDELYRYCENSGYDRHSPYDLAQVIRDYGRKDRFDETSTIEACKAHLNTRNPCIVHGWFTGSGHIIVLVGYDDKGFIVHDPYGEWFSTGYRTDLSGKFLHYSYNLIQKTCIPDGQFWVHFVE
jgi:uncharacterized protein YvpB